VIPRQWRDAKLAITADFCKRGKGFRTFQDGRAVTRSTVPVLKTLTRRGLERKHDARVGTDATGPDVWRRGYLRPCASPGGRRISLQPRPFGTRHYSLQEQNSMRHIHRPSRAASLLFSALMAAPLAAQMPAMTAPVPPMIEVGGTGEAKVTPDRALVYLGVQTKGKTAALAGQENARLATAILDAVRAAGVAREQIGTMNYTVNPSYRYYADGRKPELTGYDASNTVRVEVRNLDLVGKVIDASLGAGANNVSGITFFASQLQATKHEALGQATTDARQSAEVMAKAAGGTLGALISITSQMADVPRPFPMVAMAMRAKGAEDSTPVVAPTEQTVTATVVGRWQFIPTGAPR
jgi:uncharacterized protein YggE